VSESTGGRRRWALAILIALALCVRLPSLAWGFFADDHGLMVVLERGFDHPTMRWWSLFDFGYAPPPGQEDVGWSFLPWWTSPDFKARFFRPLASLTHAADFALFGRGAAWHHVTSLALFALLLGLVHALYRAAGLSRRLASWALAVFAFEDGSVMPVSWIANRSTLIEAVFAALAVLTLLRGAPAPSPRRIAASLVLALLASLGKESGVTTFAALAIALAILARRAGEPGVRSRLARSAAVAALCGAGYVVFLLASGHGTRSLFYVMPWTEPLDFAGRVLSMAVLGLQGAIGPFFIDLPFFFPALLVPFFAVALAVGAPIAWRIAKGARGVPWAGLFATWGALAVIPQAGTMPSDRLLFLPMIGFAPFVASFARRALERERPWRARWLPLTMAILCLPLSGLALLGRTSGQIAVNEKLRAASVSAEAPRDGTRCDALVLQSGSTLSMLSPDSTWTFLTGDTGTRFHPIQVGRQALRLTTVDERTFEVEFLDGPILGTPFEEVFLSRRETIEPGRRWRGRGFSVEARSVDATGLRAIRVVLDEPIASPRWRFLAWRDGAFRALELPPPGATLDLESPAPLHPAFP
jgi:hypothetical protein